MLNVIIGPTPVSVMPQSEFPSGSIARLIMSILSMIASRISLTVASARFVPVMMIRYTMSCEATAPPQSAVVQFSAQSYSCSEVSCSALCRLVVAPDVAALICSRPTSASGTIECTISVTASKSVPEAMLASKSIAVAKTSICKSMTCDKVAPGSSGGNGLGGGGVGGGGTGALPGGYGGWDGSGGGWWGAFAGSNGGAGLDGVGGGGLGEGGGGVFALAKLLASSTAGSSPFGLRAVRIRIRPTRAMKMQTQHGSAHRPMAARRLRLRSCSSRSTRSSSSVFARADTFPRDDAPIDRSRRCKTRGENRSSNSSP